MDNSLRALIETAPLILSDGRAEIRGLHDRGLDSLQVCGRLTSLVDGVVIKLFDAAMGELPTGQAEAMRNQAALVGLGSYGRRQSAPFSDVDLMILHDAGSPESMRPLVRPLTQSMWDIGFKLGESVRTVAEAVSLARTDPIICTSQIGARLIAGNQQLYEKFRDEFAKMVRKRSRSLAEAFHQARAEERRQYGETVYLLEPNVKRSRGALRDLHLLQWLGFVDHGEVDLDRLHLKGAMSKFEHRRLASARSYLLRLRNEMHFHANGPNETLNRAEQIRVAEVFGHRQRAGLLPVEHLMRDYFRHTNHLWQMVRRRQASLVAPSTMTRILDPVLGKNVAGGDFRVGLKNITVTAAGLTAARESLETVLRIVAASEASGKQLDHGSWSALLLAAPDCPDAVTPPVAEQFLQLLDDPEIAADAVRVLYELGYLDKLVPAMRHARCLLQFNQYHKYTVDEHSLRAVRAAADFRDRQDLLGESYRTITDKRLLHLALLLHDLGKGFEEDHCEVGRRLAEETCQRLFMSEKETHLVATLVQKHLLMSHLAFRRDTSDADEIQRFAEEIGSGRRLRMLFVLTCADLEAVGPGVLNDWKIEVLGEVYSRTASLAEVDDITHDGPPVELRRQAVFELLNDEERADPWYREHADALPASYLAGRAHEDVVELLRRCRPLAEQQCDVRGRFIPETKTVEFIAAVRDGAGRGVFSSMAGALSSQNMEILAADIEILADNLLLLRYVVTAPTGVSKPDQQYLAKISEQLAAAVASEAQPRFPKVWGQEEAEAAVRLTALPTEIRIDNEASQKGTVVEVFTFDRVGLLYALARRIHDLDLVIRHAKIGTYLDQVVDVFYVTDRDGKKIYDQHRLDAMRSEILAVASKTN